MAEAATVSEERCFLGVSQSVSGRSWRARLSANRAAEAIAERYELPEILARVLAGRGVPLDDVTGYLNPTLRALMPKPGDLADMEEGADRIAHAVMTGEQIAIIGDYDVDGVTSSALLDRFFRAAGHRPIIHIPDRLEEGYGPGREAIARLAGEGARLLITVDCGIAAHGPLAHAAELGLDVVVVDHHQADAELPEARAVVNPNRQDDLSGLGYLAAVGVTLILVAAIAKRLRDAGHFATGRAVPDLLQWLDLVALGTVCDVVPLTGLNRAYATQGFKVMARRVNPGLAALADVARLRRRPDPYAAGFVLGPRINAAGRLGQSALGLKLLTTEDAGEAAMIAQELERLNKERQEIEIAAFEAAAMDAEAQLEEDPARALLLVAGEGWHVGVLGLIASRLKERFNRAAIAIGYGAAGGFATGSGRSVHGVDLGGAVRAAHEAGLLEKGGGHAMAAGLTVDVSRIEALGEFLNEKVAAEASAALAGPSLTLDGALTASGATTELLELLERAGPYGAGNPAPVFAFPAHRVRYADLAGKDHVRCKIAAGDGQTIKAIAFRALSTPLGEMLLSVRDRPVHVAGRLVIDDWGGARAPQLLIDDAALVS